jgi:N-acetyl sugar amidotransferase
MESNLLNTRPYKVQYHKICSRCIMDDTVRGIEFDEEGVCQFCRIQDILEQKFPMGEAANHRLEKIVSAINKTGKGKKYNCIVGVSGGRDSTYTLFNTVRLGLRPLVVHFDNGWNSDIAVKNIKNACKILGVDLYTHVADWEEFKDLERSFLLASVPDAEVPTDWVIFSVLYKVAAKEGVKFIIQGHSFRTEGTTPLTWTYMDGRYVKYIHRKFGKTKIRSFPIMTLTDYIYYTFLKGIRQVRLLYHIPYDEKNVLDLLSSKLNWINYGGKHHESKYTAFFQAYILTRKFNIDKRKLHYSALLRSGQMTREQAMDKIQADPYPGGKDLLEYCVKKLDFTPEEFEEIMNTEIKSFTNYKSYYPFIKLMRKPLKWGTRLGLIPETAYMKYFHF